MTPAATTEQTFARLAIVDGSTRPVWRIDEVAPGLAVIFDDRVWPGWGLLHTPSGYLVAPLLLWTEQAARDAAAVLGGVDWTRNPAKLQEDPQVLELLAFLVGYYGRREEP